MPNLPFTICTEDYAKDGTATIFGYSCEADYPITNINNKNRLSYAKFNAAATTHAGFEIDLGAIKGLDLIIIELSRPYLYKQVSAEYWVSPAWWNITGLIDYKYLIVGTAAKLPGQITQYMILHLNAGTLNTQKIRFKFDDENGATQIEIRRVIACGIIDEFNGGSDFYGPEEQSHSNVGKIQVPLIHGNAFRGQSFGALKQSKQMRFSEINPDQFKLLEDLESDYQTFGILDWTGRYVECFVIPAGLQVKDSGVDADGSPWSDVTMRVQER